MPLREETIDLAEEVERLREEKEAKAAEQVDFPMGSDGARQAAQEGQRADRFLNGVAWAQEEWDAKTVSFGALTNGERHLVKIIVDESNLAADAMRQNTYVAVGTREAPYLAHDPDELTKPDARDDIRETAGNVSNVHPAFADWAESKISELDRVGRDMGKSYRELVLEKRRRASSQSENG